MSSDPNRDKKNNEEKNSAEKTINETKLKTPSSINKSKLFRQIAVRTSLSIAIVPALALAFILLYLLWPQLYPRFAPGTCILNQKNSVIYEIVGKPSLSRGTSVQVKVLSTDGKEFNTEYIDINEHYISEIICPN